MTTLPLITDHLAAVVDLLEDDGILVTTENEWPDGAGWQDGPDSTFVKFCRVADVPGAAPTGQIDGVRSDRRFVFHVQSIGASRAQADALRDRVHALVASGALSIPGRALLEPPRHEEPGQTTPDTDVSPSVFVGWDQYRVWTTPA